MAGKIVQLIRGLNLNTPARMVKDGRSFSGAFLEPGIYVDWPKDVPIPSTAKILEKLPDPELLEARGTPVIDTLAAQTEAMIAKANAEQPADDVRPKKAGAGGRR